MANTEKGAIVFHCYAYPAKNKGHNGFYAICIDLSLTTWRPTFHGAKKSLDDAIEGYLECVLDCPEEMGNNELRRKVMRPAPFWPFRAQYHALSLLSHIAKRRTPKPIYEFDYDGPCAVPA